MLIRVTKSPRVHRGLTGKPCETSTTSFLRRRMVAATVAHLEFGLFGLPGMMNANIKGSGRCQNTNAKRARPEKGKREPPTECGRRRCSEPHLECAIPSSPCRRTPVSAIRLGPGDFLELTSCCGTGSHPVNAWPLRLRGSSQPGGNRQGRPDRSRPGSTGLPQDRARLNIARHRAKDRRRPFHEMPPLCIPPRGKPGPGFPVRLRTRMSLIRDLPD